MKNKTIKAILLAVSLLGLGALHSPAQPASFVAPRFIQITEDNIKQGCFDEYELLQQEKARILKAANWKRVSIGLTHRYGPSLKVYHYSFYKTLEEVDTERKELGSKNPELKSALKKVADQEAKILASRNVSMIIYKPNLSYQGDCNWADFRCMSMINIQLKAGMHDTYAMARDITKKGKEAVKAPQNIAIYGNFCGMQSWQYFIIRPVKAFKAFDELDAFIHTNSYADKFGKENREKMLECFRNSVASEHEYYLAFDPAISYTTPEWAGVNADFWKP